MKENLIYGTLLGDGCIHFDRTTPILILTHCEKQLEYLKWKYSALGAKTKISKRISGYGSTMYSFRYSNASLLHKVYNNCIDSNGSKQISEKWLSKLNELSLAIWYQDDGNWGSCGKKINGRYAERYVRFSTCAFNKNSLELLSYWLKNKYQIDNRIKYYSSYPYIVLGQSSTIKLWNMVAPYIVIKNKIDIEIRPGVHWCACGNSLRSSEKECDNCLYQRAINWNKPLSRNQPGYYDLVNLLKRRFGTGSITKLRGGRPLISIPNAHWIDISRIGSIHCQPTSK